jgi:O-antigen/teichoic acid export membrane protein
MAPETVRDSARPPDASVEDAATGDGRPADLSAKRVLTGFIVLSAARIGTQALGFAAIVIAAHRLGPGNLGPYNFSVSVGVYFALAADFGISVLAIRDVAREPHRTREVMGEVLVLQAVIGAIAFGLLVALTPVISPDSKTDAVLPIAGGAAIATVVLGFGWTLRALHRMGAVAIAELVGQAAYVALVPLLVNGGLTGAKNFAWLHVLGTCVTAAVTWIAIWRIAGPPATRTLDARSILRRLRASLPIGFSFAMIQVYVSIDSLMLGYMRDTRTVGEYGVAYKIPLAIVSFAALWVSSLYPHAAALFAEHRDRLRRQVSMFAGFALIVAVGLGVGATFTGDDLIPAIFGGHFDAAATPFILLMWSSAIIIVSVNFGNVLLACGDERRYAIGVTVGAVVNVLVNLVAIPAWGANGAAIATIIAESVVLSYMLVRFRRVVGPLSLERARIARGLAASGALAAVLIALPSSMSVFARIAVGTAVYLVAMVAFRAVDRDELRALVKRQARA